MTAKPTKDQSYCDVGNHPACSGHTEDQSDPESCMCSCHDEPFASELESQAADAGFIDCVCTWQKVWHRTGQEGVEERSWSITGYVVGCHYHDRIARALQFADYFIEKGK